MDGSLDIAKMSFEDALGELEKIVRQLESGQASLEQSIAQYERGAQLKSHCDAKLAQAKLRIEKITQNADGTISSVAEIDSHMDKPF